MGINSEEMGINSEETAISSEEMSIVLLCELYECVLDGDVLVGLDGHVDGLWLGCDELHEPEHDVESVFWVECGDVVLHQSA